MTSETRGVPARIGIVALNLLAPGLGLLRVQRLRSAILFLILPAILMALLIAVYASVPLLDFAAWAGLVVMALAAALVIYLGSILLCWRASRIMPTECPWWSRWYGILAALVLATALNWSLPDIGRSYYHPFYLPAESMAPTLLKYDRLVAYMRPGELRRGDIIIFRVGRFDYVKRVAALPGDRIEMIEGVFYLNGQPVPQRFVRTERIENPVGPSEARRLLEQFPGEAHPHEIYDLGYTQGDDVPAQRVLPGHLFVLGDNRDQSADSRFPRDMMGVEQLPISDVIGIARFIYWRPGSGAIGAPLVRD